MTDPLEGVTDAHLQAALDDFLWTKATPTEVRNRPTSHPVLIAHARTIAANEKLAAELAELRAKYEPAPVDPVKAAVEALYDPWSQEWDEGTASSFDFGERCIRRGMEMQPAPFTREQAYQISIHLDRRHHGSAMSCVLSALTTPRADLLAMLGDG